MKYYDDEEIEIVKSSSFMHGYISGGVIVSAFWLITHFWGVI